MFITKNGVIALLNRFAEALQEFTSTSSEILVKQTEVINNQSDLILRLEARITALEKLNESKVR